MWINAWDSWILCSGRGAGSWGGGGIKGAELAFVLLQHDAPAWACHIEVHLPRTTNLFICWRLKWGWHTTLDSGKCADDWGSILSVQCSCDNVTAIAWWKFERNRQRWGRQETVDNEDGLFLMVRVVVVIAMMVIWFIITIMIINSIDNGKQLWWWAGGDGTNDDIQVKVKVKAGWRTLDKEFESNRFDMHSNLEHFQCASCF